MEPTVLMSIRPIYASAVFDGTKRHEFRRIPVRISRGARVLVYETAPVSRVTGEFIVGRVHVGTPAELAGLEPSEALRSSVKAYLDGAKQPSAIEIISPRRWSNPARLEGFVPSGRPPQSYMYLQRP